MEERVAELVRHNALKGLISLAATRDTCGVVSSGASEDELLAGKGDQTKALPAEMREAREERGSR